jgi:NAD(P)H-dependent FMN reductase
MKLIAISGSLRATSLNTAVLQAAARLAPAGVEIDLCEGIGKRAPCADGRRAFCEMVSRPDRR